MIGCSRDLNIRYKSILIISVLKELKRNSFQRDRNITKLYFLYNDHPYHDLHKVSC